MNRYPVTRLTGVLAVAFTVSAATVAHADGTDPAHRPPIAGEEWINPINKSHNHNTFIEWNMENITKQPVYQYDGYGSWYRPPGGGAMVFHPSATAAGKDHGDAVRFGHGFIPKDRPVLYNYTASFLDNIGAGVADNDGAYAEWNTEINSNAAVFRKPKTVVGFDWRRATIGEAADVTIDWRYQTYGGKSDLFTDADGDGRYDVGEAITSDDDGDGMFDTIRNTAWVLPSANPETEFFGGYWLDDVYRVNDFFFGGAGALPAGKIDFYTVALHEAGHIVGLDDLYAITNADGTLFQDGFRNSLMGLGAAGTFRDIDLGSIQGGVDLYTIPVPVPATLLLLLSGLTGLAVTRRRGHVTRR